MPELRDPATGRHTRASHATTATLVDQGWEEIFKSSSESATETPTATEPPATKGATIDQLNGKALDAAAEKLGITDWNAKAKVDAKRDTLKEAVAARLAELDIEGLTYESPIDDLLAAITAKTEQ
jgi:hypothetical protein